MRVNVLGTIKHMINIETSRSDCYFVKFKSDEGCVSTIVLYNEYHSRRSKIISAMHDFFIKFIPIAFILVIIIKM